MSKISQRKIFEVIGSLYENAQKTSNEAWTNVYKQMAELFSSGPGGLTIYNTRDNQFQAVMGTLDPKLLAENLGFFQSIPFRDRLNEMKVGDRFSRRDVISDEALKKTDIYRNLLTKAGMFHIEYFVFTKRGGIHGGISFSRPESERNFGADERAAMESIMPHLERAFQLYLQLHDTRRENRMMAEAFNRIPQSVMIVDSDQRVVFANHGAQEILELKDGLDIDSNGRLRATTAADARELRSTLESVIAASSGDVTAENSGVVQVSRPSGRRAIEVVAAPFVEENPGGLPGRQMAILFLSNQQQKLQNIDTMLRRMYGLTPAEARVAAMLTDGKTLSNVCEKLNIKPNTARTHLKHIFSKTETNRQSELVTLILSGPGRLREYPAPSVPSKAG